MLDPPCINHPLPGLVHILFTMSLIYSKSKTTVGTQFILKIKSTQVCIILSNK